MRIIVDVDDPDDVTALIIDRVADLQIDDELPLYPVTVSPMRRIIADSDNREGILHVGPVPTDPHDAP
jgi:hypothetical protein